MEKLEAFVEACCALRGVHDAVIAQDLQQTANIWRLRDGMAEAVVKHGAPRPLALAYRHACIIARVMEQVAGLQKAPACMATRLA